MADRVPAIYARVSHLDQSLASQLPDLERWAESEDGPCLWFKDHFTGLTVRRPGFGQLSDAIEAGKISKVVVWRLDRLGRSAADLTRFFEYLQRVRVGLISLREGVDLDTPAGRLMAHVIASVAQYDTEVRRERQMAGIAAAKAKGKTWGGSKPGRALKLKPNVIKRIKEMAASGVKKTEIARALGLSRKTIYLALRTESASS
jgi:DNA invertase Pin-like site-specific DNA recombinase